MNRGRRRTPSQILKVKSGLFKDQAEVDYGALEIITPDNLKDGAIADLTPPAAQAAQSGNATQAGRQLSYRRTPSIHGNPRREALKQEVLKKEALKQETQKQQQLHELQEAAQRKQAQVLEAQEAQKQAQQTQKQAQITKNEPEQAAAIPVATVRSTSKIMRVAAGPSEPQVAAGASADGADSAIAKVDTQDQQAQQSISTETHRHYGIEDSEEAAEVAEVHDVAEAHEVAEAQEKMAVEKTSNEGDSSAPAISATSIASRDPSSTPTRRRRTLLPLMFVFGASFGYVAATWHYKQGVFSVSSTSAQQKVANINNAPPLNEDDDVEAERAAGLSEADAPPSVGSDMSVTDAQQNAPADIAPAVTVAPPSTGMLGQPENQTSSESSTESAGTESLAAEEAAASSSPESVLNADSSTVQSANTNKTKTSAEAEPTPKEAVSTMPEAEATPNAAQAQLSTDEAIEEQTPTTITTTASASQANQAPEQSEQAASKITVPLPDGFIAPIAEPNAKP